MTSDNFKTILVAIDGSPESAAGLERAIRQATNGGAARLHVMDVLEPPFIDTAEAGPLEIAKEYQRQEAYLPHHFERAKKRLHAADFETQPEVLGGSAKATIVDRAKALGADLIVVGGPWTGPKPWDLISSWSAGHAMGCGAADCAAVPPVGW